MVVACRPPLYGTSGGRTKQDNGQWRHGGPTSEIYREGGGGGCLVTRELIYTYLRCEAQMITH